MDITRARSLPAVLAMADDLVVVVALDFDLGLAAEADTGERHFGDCFHELTLEERVGIRKSQGLAPRRAAIYPIPSRRYAAPHATQDSPVKEIDGRSCEHVRVC